jgi:hypothetical protein
MGKSPCHDPGIKKQHAVQRAVFLSLQRIYFIFQETAASIAGRRK